MQLHFYKYQGTGNDFILLDNRTKQHSFNQQQISFLCHRNFGIGADGLILLELEPGFDFKMVYFNSDGNQSTMCGNGGRCITAFAKQLNLIENKCKFLAIDGEHEASIDENNFVALKMKDVKSVEQSDEDFVLNTGSPHYIKLVESIDTLDVFAEGKKIRNSELFFEEGINVNFIQQKEDKIFVRTYERGVENETLSCGTGVTASAIVASKLGISTSKNYCDVITKGGELSVSFEKVLEDTFYNIWLKGNVSLVFEGSIQLPQES